MRSYAFLALSPIKKLKRGLFCKKLGTQLYLVYVIVLKWLDLKIIVICQKLCVQLRFFGFLCFFGISCIKQLKIGLFYTKLCTQHYLVYINVLKWSELKIIFICQKLRAKLKFYGFLSFIGTFANIVHAETWFVQHETWHTTIFGLYCCVEVVRNENNSHMLHITC